MRTIQFIPSESSRKRIASETLEIYAPLAGRLGMHEFKDELEDLSFLDFKSFGICINIK